MSDRRASVDPQVILARQEQLVLQARLAFEAYRGQMDRLVESVRQACKAYVDLLANPARKVRPVPPVLPDPRVRMALLALRDQPAHLAPPARRASPGPRA